MRENLKAIIQHILGVKTLRSILAQSCHLISVRRIDVDLPRPFLHSSTILVAPKFYQCVFERSVFSLTNCYVRHVEKFREGTTTYEEDLS